MSNGPSSPAPGGSIGTSYPSPISSAGHRTPSLQDETNSQSVGEPQTQGRSDGVPDTQQSLRAASAALQAAYRRIRQVRRNLVELTDPLPPSPDSLTGDIGPNHSALLLTTSPMEDGTDFDDATIDFQRIRANLAAVDRQSQEYLDRYAPPNFWTDHQPPLNPDIPRPRRHVQLPSPPSPAELPPQPAVRRSMLESQFARRREFYNSDDPSTFLGRRVAAREAAGSSRVADTPSPQPPLDSIIRHAEMERELISLRSLNFNQQQRRTDPGVAAHRAEAIARAEILRAARSLDTEQFRSAQRAAQRPQPQVNTNLPPLPRPPPPMPRRWRSYRASAETRQGSNNTQPPVSSHPDGRLSILSNFSSMQNLPTPSSTMSRERPLLFEEPQSFTGQLRGSNDIVESPIGLDRSYFIHRRVNADGDELVHNINLEWDEEDPWSWFVDNGASPDFSAYPRRRVPPTFLEAHGLVHDRIETRAPPAPIPPPLPEPRRRGWARLDPDGNAIPSDEEEELERSRAEYRIRALYQTRASGGNGIVVPRLGRHPQAPLPYPEHDNLITGTHPDDHPVREYTASPRVRLGSRDSPGQRLGYGSVMDSVLAVDNRPRRSPIVSTDVPYGSAVPFVVDPLPIPLSEMVPSKKEQKRRPTWVPVAGKAAGLAGR
ncbi:hypothetical protein R3P38DRAFT_54592 [Favolaschia claudopus]|uniref:Uncharacterized protein n=1 Tax=Favolaschia claudopus TaxID=2862362 RepID=A0AAW0EI82_9AGAR